MHLAENPVTRVTGQVRTRALEPRLCTTLHPYALGCYPYYRLLMRITVLTSYRPIGVTRGRRAGHSRQQAELLTPLLGGILLAQLRKLPDS